MMPVYNAAPFLETSIGCVLAQTFSDWELILVNDGSSDGSVEKIRGIRERHPEARIRLLDDGRNDGAAAARNKGIRAAGGRYLAFLDADDLWLPGKLDHQVRFMEETGAAFSCTAYEFGDTKGKGTGRIVHAKPCLTYKKALTRTIVFTSTVMLDLHQLSREQVQMPECPSEDTALWWQLMREGSICRGLDEVLTIYRRSAGTLSSDKREAVRRIWYLYRQREHLNPLHAAVCLAGWAVRATLRRL